MANSSGGVAFTKNGSDYPPFEEKTYDDPHAWRGPWYRVTVPVLLLFCVVAFFTNLSILVSVRWLRRRHLSPTLCFSVSLAVADAYASLVVGVGLVINSLLPVTYDVQVSMCLVMVLEGFRLAGLLISVLHLLLLAVNHYIGILRPLHYASTMTRRAAILSMALLWAAPLGFVFAYLGGEPGAGLQSEGCAAWQFIAQRRFRTVVGSLFFAPLALMFAVYAHIFVIVLRHNRGLRRQCQGAPPHLRRNVKAAVTTLVFIGTYALGWMPAILFYVSVCLDCVVRLEAVDDIVVFAVSLLANALIVLKLLVNPIIYTARMKDIRAAIKGMLAAACWPRLAADSDASTAASVNTNTSFSRSMRCGDAVALRSSFRLHSLYGKGRKSGAEDTPILLYQKRSRSDEEQKPCNGLVAEASLPGGGVAVETYVTSPNNTVTPLLLS